MDRRFQFPKDSSLKILTSGLLGEQYVGIEPGADDKLLAPGDTITTTQSAVVLENLIGQFLYNKAAEGPPATPGTPKK
jgi:phospholipid/cholesterol/gamma-HCH transport system substrate-binding protein